MVRPPSEHVNTMLQKLLLLRRVCWRSSWRGGWFGWFLLGFAANE
jgi:hypothetical protein